VLSGRVGGGGGGGGGEKGVDGVVVRFMNRLVNSRFPLYT